MMNKEIAKALLPIVNDNFTMETFDKYVVYRIYVLRASLETLADINEIRKVQGAIQELKRMVSLRDEVLQELKDAK